MEFQIAITDPTPEQLKEIALAVEGLTINGIEDKEWFERVKKNRILIRDMRVTIEKQCKAQRDNAIKYQKDVIAYEKSLIALIEPAEKKLKSMEEEIKQLEILESRKSMLPVRMKYLEWEKMLTEDKTLEEREQFVLSMDDEAFMRYTQKIQEDRKLELERIANEERIRKEREAEILAAEQRAIELEKQKVLDKKIEDRNNILKSIGLVNNKFTSKYLNIDFSSMDVMHLNDVDFHNKVMDIKFQIELANKKEKEEEQQQQTTEQQIEIVDEQLQNISIPQPQILEPNVIKVSSTFAFREEDGRARYILKWMSKNLDFLDGEHEDNNIWRNFSGVLEIGKLIKEANQMGLNWITIELEEREEDDIFFDEK